VIRLPVNSWPLLRSLTLLVLISLLPAAAAQERRHVLILYGSEKDLPMNVIVDGQLRSSFRESLSESVELYSEYIDVSRFPDKGYPRKLLDLLREKYRARGLDLIVVVETSALDAIQLHHDWFFPTTPVVFCCVTQAEYQARAIRPGVTGIPAKLDYGPTLEVALRLHPGTRHVVVISGASKMDAETMADARRDFRPFEGKAEFRYLVDLPMAQLREEVSRLSGDTIIIHLSIYQDGAGKFFIPRDALDQVAKTASVPIYGYYDAWLGHGIVGGFVASFEIEATNAAHLGLRLLAGEKAEELAPAGATSCGYQFDWRELKRWGLNEASLPPGSVIRFRDPSFWDLYWWQFVGVLSLCAVQAGLILGLLVQRARRRRSESERQQALEQLRTSLEQQRNLASRVFRAQEVEKRRLAREMHDDLTQRLAVMAIEIGKLEEHLDLPGPVAELLTRTGDQLVKLSEDVHALSRQLHPSILDDLGLADALRSECVTLQRREGIAVIHQIDNVQADLPRESALCLYRIAQEALRNVVRHAGTSRVEVSLLGHEGEVLLTVSDKGKGFVQNGSHSRPGLGLASMEERARLIGAELSILSHPGQGTTVSVLVPRGGRES
jgi:signal transduction histidine kinase